MTTLSRRGFLAAAGAGAVGAGAALLGGLPAAAAPSRLKSLIDHHLANAVSNEGHVGVVIGAFGHGRHYVGGAGRLGAPGSPTPDGSTIFQIGSITKTFTGLALALGHLAGRTLLHDPVAKHLPAHLRVPGKGPHPIRLLNLATHTSGLPELPPGIAEEPEFDPRDPYAAFTMDDLAAALTKTELASEPGVPSAYSNYAFGLLGHALEFTSRTGFADLVRKRIALPLGLYDTTITLDPAQLRRKAMGHAGSEPTPDWHMPTLGGCGALYGTVNDLLMYLRAQLGQAPAHLQAAMKLARQPRFPLGENASIGLAWMLQPLPTSGRTVIWHNGGMGGFRSFTGFCQDTGTGVAILTNTDKWVDDIGFAVLDALDSWRA